MKRRMPQTDAEWQEAVNLAEIWLQVDSARKYGLVTGGPDVDVERCEELLKAGAAKGFRPQTEEGARP